MVSRVSLPTLLTRSAARARTHHRLFSAFRRNPQAGPGLGPRGSNRTVPAPAWSGQPKTWSGAGVLAVAAAAAVATWAATWATQQKDNAASTPDLTEFGVDVGPRYATMDEMKEVGDKKTHFSRVAVADHVMET